MNLYNWKVKFHQLRDEIQAEAQRLVKLGVQDFDAIVQARQTVERKHREDKDRSTNG